LFYQQDMVAQGGIEPPFAD